MKFFISVIKLITFIAADYTNQGCNSLSRFPIKIIVNKSIFNKKTIKLYLILEQNFVSFDILFNDFFYFTKSLFGFSFGH